MNDDLQRFIEELRARVSIVDVVGAKVKLTKKGREYQGLCPFHNEKTPSFTVNESKGFYHCFGCGAHGDIIKFEMEANGLPFIDALQKLSHQAGLQMPQLTAKDKKEEEERKSLYDIMETACLFFEKSLRMPEGSEGLKYFLEKRNLTKETIKKFRLGFSPNNNGLMSHLKAEGVDEKEMKELGLIAIPEDSSRRPHDFFRNRVMIPITNKQGKIIAFGGRVMEKIEPKYLNSPDTPIFNKRRNLYNLDKAREVAYKEKNLIICEGYMDVIALDSYGFGYAVAPLGTALTEEQIMEAWRVCPEPILCLDGDSPGVKAAMRAVDRVLPMLKAGYSLKFLFLPDNQDPDEYLRAHGRESFAALMKNTRPLIDILWQKYTENEDSSTPEKKALIEKTLLGEVAKIGDATVRSYYSQEIRNRIYKAFRQTAWQKQEYSRPERPKVSPAPSVPRQINPEPPSYMDNIPINEGNIRPQMIQKAEQTASYSANNQVRRSYQTSPSAGTYGNNRYNNNNRRTGYGSRPTINHTISNAPETLKQKVESENDKNIRFIIAAELIYPELIDDYEEQLFSIEIKNNKLKDALSTISDIYHASEEPLSSEELIKNVKESSLKDLIKDLWELDMIQKQSPFINELRHNIEKILLDSRRQNLEEEIKELTKELCLNFDEATYNRLTALKKERDEILSTATEPEN